MRFCIQLSVLAMFGALVACGNDNGMGDGGTADAGSCVQANFTSIHDGILSTPTCAIVGCHATAAVTSGSLNLKGGKAAVHATLLEAAFLAGNGNRVEPNSSATSFLYTKISQEMPPGLNGRMPTGGKLQDCDIAAIRQWIDDGAPNN